MTHLGGGDLSLDRNLRFSGHGFGSRFRVENRRGFNHRFDGCNIDSGLDGRGIRNRLCLDRGRLLHLSYEQESSSESAPQRPPRHHFRA